MSAEVIATVTPVTTTAGRYLAEVRSLLERLANGESVALGEFGTEVSGDTDADVHAAILRDIADSIQV